MKASEDHLRPTAWIPWVLVLVALVGGQVLLPEAAQGRKCRNPDACSLTLGSADCPGSDAEPQGGVVLVPQGAGGFKVAAPPPVLLEIDRRGHFRAIPGVRGAVQGRAPPGLWFA